MQKSKEEGIHWTVPDIRYSVADTGIVITVPYTGRDLENCHHCERIRGLKYRQKSRLQRYYLYFFIREDRVYTNVQKTAPRNVFSAFRRDLKTTGLDTTLMNGTFYIGFAFCDRQFINNLDYC